MSQSTTPEPSTIPSNANEGCVGPTSTTAGKASACAGCPNQSACASGKFNSPEAQAQRSAESRAIRASLHNISHIVLILSGKGGVGKSTVACQISHTLAMRGYAVGLLDVDICGPSVPRMTGVSGRTVHKSANGWCPVFGSNPNLAIMSINFLLPDTDSAVVWRGPRKNGLIKQFLTETDWTMGGGGGDGDGDDEEDEDGLDFLIIDTPPGTSDEHISIVQFLQGAIAPMEGITTEQGTGPDLGAVLVTTPEEVSMADVRKEINFCQKTKLRVWGIVENMSTLRMKLADMTFLRHTQAKKENGENNINGNVDDDGNAHGEEECTNEVLELLRMKCPEVLDTIVSTDVFPMSGTGPRGMAIKYNVPYLGSLPLDPNLLKSCEDGVCFVESYPTSPAVRPLNVIVDKLVRALLADEEIDMEEG